MPKPWQEVHTEWIDMQLEKAEADLRWNEIVQVGRALRVEWGLRPPLPSGGSIQQTPAGRDYTRRFSDAIKHAGHDLTVEQVDELKNHVLNRLPDA